MFEMFATIVAAAAAAIYGLSRSVFMTGVHRNLYRAAFIGIIIIIYVTYRIIITSSFGESKSCMSILMIIFIMISTPLHFIGQVTLSVTLYRIFSLITLT